MVVVVVLLISCGHIRPCEQALAGLAVSGRQGVFEVALTARPWLGAFGPDGSCPV